MEVAELRASTKERLDNGSRAFSDLRTSVGALGEAVKPRHASIGRVIALTVAIVSLAGGALWGLSAMISNRPTLEQVREVVSDHADNGHPHLQKDLSGIQQEQAIHRVKLESIERSTTEIRAVLRDERRPRPR